MESFALQAYTIDLMCTMTTIVLGAMVVAIAKRLRKRKVNWQCFVLNYR